MTDFDKFLLWEAKSRDTIDFKKIYVDIAEDLVAGLLLSQIIYWYLPSDEQGKTKLRVKKEGSFWIAKGREDWWNEIRITAKQFDRASNILIDKGIIAKDYFRFNGLRTIHIRLYYGHFMELWQAQLESPAITQRSNPQSPKGEDRALPKVKPAITQRGRPLTESTAENTTDLNGSAKNSENSFSDVIKANSYIEKYTDTEREALNKLGKVIGQSGNIGHIQTADELRTITRTGFDIAKITEMDILAIDLTELRALAGLTIRLSSKGNIAAKLNAFSEWWYNVYWLGKDKGQPPSIKQMGSTWGQFEADKVAPAPTDSGPTLSDVAKQNYARLIAEQAK